MNSTPNADKQQTLTLVLVGLVVGAAWGGLLVAIINWSQISSNDYDAARGLTWIIAAVTILICFACVYLGRWFTRLDGRIHALTCAVALIAAADVLWLAGRLNFTSISHGELWCLVISLVTFIFTAGYICGPRDKLFH